MREKKANTSKQKMMKCKNPNCMHGGELQPFSKFYISNQEGIERYPICKDCLKEQVKIDKMSTVYEILRNLNVAFFPDVWIGVLKNSPDNPFGNYMRIVGSLPKYKGVPFSEDQIKNVDINSSEIIEEEKKKQSSPLGYIVPDAKSKEQIAKEKEELAELKKFWGEGFTETEYRAMANKWNLLVASYPLKTSFHVEGLKNYIIPRVKADLCFAKNETEEAQNWIKAADKAAANARINVSQLSDKDLGETIDTFSMWAKHIEETTDVYSLIKAMEVVRYNPIDSVDFEIWCLINFWRRLEDKPEVSYKDIYKFYDEAKKAYINEKGDPYKMFEGDPTSENRKKIMKFIEPLLEDETDG